MPRLCQLCNEIRKGSHYSKKCRGKATHRVKTGLLGHIYICDQHYNKTVKKLLTLLAHGNVFDQVQQFRNIDNYVGRIFGPSEMGEDAAQRVIGLLAELKARRPKIPAAAFPFKNLANEPKRVIKKRIREAIALHKNNLLYSLNTIMEFRRKARQHRAVIRRLRRAMKM
jgi:hypothetical protein